MKTQTVTKKQSIAAQRIAIAESELTRWATKLSVNLSNFGGGNWYSDGNNLQQDFYDGETQYHFICYFRGNSADGDGSELEKNY